MADETYDAIVIGSGPGGSSCATLLQKRGIRTLLLEKNGFVGGKMVSVHKDGYSYDLPAEMLRVMSPSAEVQGHSAEQRVTVPGKRNVKIKTMQPVGKYATKIAFDDGHDTGLYSWSYLLELGQNKDAKWKAYLEELAAKGMNRG